MTSYFIRRLLLIFPTLLGITLLTFAITRFVPGGPVDRALQLQAQAAEKGGSRHSGGNAASGGMSNEQLEALEEHYGLNKPILVGYAQWLGISPRESQISKGEYTGPSNEFIGEATDTENTAKVVLAGEGRLAQVKRADGKISSATFLESGQPLESEGWQVRYESENERKQMYQKRNPAVETPPAFPPRVVIFKNRFAGLLQGNLGRSDVYNEPVGQMIMERLPVGLYFGILTSVIAYGLCLPLGILKALKHRTFIDTATSMFIFLGYSIPGFALGTLLIVHLGAGMNLFPLSGLTSADFDTLSYAGKIKDLAHHTILPLICYVIGSFAMLTMMTKNSLMDQLAADYVRTAVAKGASFPRAAFRHAFRNSIIPVASGLGGLISILLTGSILIESVFDIQGFGLLQYQAVLALDVPVIMGTMTISAFLMLFGNVLSDAIVALVDPRIKFN